MKVVLRKTGLKIQKTPPAHQNSTSGERISREIFEILIFFLFCFVLKLFLRSILFHGKISFDNLTYFKLYGKPKVAIQFETKGNGQNGIVSHMDRSEVKL